MWWISTNIALAGAPVGYSSATVASEIPRNGTVEVSVKANCTGDVPPDAASHLTLFRDDAAVMGSWEAGPTVLDPQGKTEIWRFVPSAALTAGDYELLGLGRLSGRSANPRDETRTPVRIRSEYDMEPPADPILAGAACVPDHHSEGCWDGVGVTFAYGEGVEGVPTLVFRRSGQSHAEAQRFRGNVLRLDTLPPGLGAGTWIVGIETVDAAGNFTLSRCEVEIQMPATRTCTEFPPVAQDQEDALSSVSRHMSMPSLEVCYAAIDTDT